MKIRLGLPLIGNGQWRGGLNYQRTLIQLLAEQLSDRIEALIFVAPDQAELASVTFGPWLTHPPIVDPRMANAGMGRRALTALLLGQDRDFCALLAEHRVDVVFETARFFGAFMPIPALVWIPDFQHRHLPHLFSRRAWWKRDLGFRAQTRGLRLVMLSSEDARNDCERFYPRTRGRTAVARFAAQMDIEAVRQRAEGITGDHMIPGRYFYLPNQFWAHKNHALVVEALKVVRERRGSLDGFPPVVMSGATTDSRDPGLFARVMGSVTEMGLSPWVRHLGLVPFADVLALNAAAIAIVNPSRFEGWATSVEEGKALGTPLILSDIDVHREQAPDAAFFGVSDANALARCLMDAAAGTASVQEPLSVLSAAKAERIAAFASGLLRAVETAHRLRK